jgi:hypothetical protein
MEDSLVYRSYLLRLWQVREQAGLAWRASLEEVSTGVKRGFTSMEELAAYFHSITQLDHHEDEKGS